MFDKIIGEIFLALEEETSSVIAKYLSLCVTAVICLAISSDILSSMYFGVYTPSTCSSPSCDNDPVLCPSYQICEPIQLAPFDVIDSFCVYFFTVEYLVRLLTCWSVSPRLASILPADWEQTHPFGDPQPSYPNWKKVWYYFIRFNNLVDFSAIFPYYIGLLFGGGQSTSFLRILRLFRLLRLLRLLTFIKNVEVTIGLIAMTAINSAQTVAVFFFFVLIVVILFGCIITIFEQGKQIKSIF